MKTPIALLSALVLALPACKSDHSTAQSSTQSKPAASDHAKISNEIVALAEVVGVDAAERVVTLRREDGTEFRVKCGEAVRNFAQIAAGDTLRVKYKETLDATRLPPEASATPTAAALAAGRAKPGKQPGAGVGVAVSVCVKIVSIDREREIVVFSLPSGELIARPIVTPEGREFVKGLKLGDLVRLDYTEVLALTVEKV
jgi:hypothetical protein